MGGGFVLPEHCAFQTTNLTNYGVHAIRSALRLRHKVYSNGSVTPPARASDTLEPRTRCVNMRSEAPGRLQNRAQSGLAIK
jgi:hypothetical protein